MNPLPTVNVDWRSIASAAAARTAAQVPAQTHRFVVLAAGAFAAEALKAFESLGPGHHRLRLAHIADPA